MVHMVRGHQHSVCTVYKHATSHMDASASITRMGSETDSRPRQGQVSMLQSQEMNSTAQYSFQTSDRSWHGTPHA